MIRAGITVICIVKIYETLTDKEIEFAFAWQFLLWVPDKANTLSLDSLQGLPLILWLP